MMKPDQVLNKLLKNRSSITGEFCYLCGEKVIHGTNAQGDFFICTRDPSHQSPRAFIFDDKTIYHIEKEGVVHQTAGAIIIKKEENNLFYLLFLRRKFPYLYTLPAGHVESHVTLLQNITREVKEETGLRIVRLTALWPDEAFHLPDPCRRGADYHDWRIFEVITEGHPVLSDEGRIIGWYRQDEIEQMAMDGLLTHPTAFFLEKYWQ